MTGCIIQWNCVLLFRLLGFVTSNIYEHKPTQPWGIPRTIWWFLQGKLDVSTVPAQLLYISGASRGAFQQPVVIKCMVQWLRVLARSLSAVHKDFYV